MTRESKVKLLEAYDALCAIQSGAPALPRRSAGGHGGSARCDVCQCALASSLQHKLDCPIGAALSALGEVVPYFNRRAEWLAAEEETRSA